MGMQMQATRSGIVGVAVAVVVGTAGCSAPKEVGTLSGRLLVIGGPSLQQSANGGGFPVSGKVTIIGPSGSRDVHVGSDGTFAVDLSPGRYSLKGSTEPTVGRGPDCTTTNKIEIAAGSHMTVDALCPMF
jgi:hypothetical protein